MTKSTFSLLLACGLLAACGGGGSSNNATITPNNPATPLPNQSNTSTAPAPSAAYIGRAYIVPTNTTAATKVYDTSSNSAASMTVNGNEVAVMLPGIFSRGFTIIDGNTSINGKSYARFITSGSSYASKFGYVTENNQDYIFSHGAPTTNMPIAGRVEYDGDAIVGKAGGNITVGDADFIADFGQKTFHGRITTDGQSTFPFNPIHINAVINGNSFATTGGAVSSSGHFYGYNAAEVGGVFQDGGQGIVGSFGARKDD